MKDRFCQTTIIQDLCSGNEDAEVALLLALVPNVSHLQLAHPPDSFYEDHRPWLCGVFDLATGTTNDYQPCQRNRFAQLRKVTILEADPNHRADWMSEMLSIPSLRSLDGYSLFRLMHYRDALGIIKAEPSNVTSLTLLESKVQGSDQFYAIMTSFKALRRFDLLLTHGTSGESPWVMQPMRVYLAELLHILSPQMETLETINVRTTFGPWHEGYVYGGSAEAVTFRHFRALRKLSVLQKLLLPNSFAPRLQDATLTDMSTDTLFAALPFSIEEIEITHCYILVIWKHLHHLLDHVASFNSSIRKITTVSENHYEKRYAQLFSQEERRARLVEQGSGQVEVERREGNSTSTDSPGDQDSIGDNTVVQHTHPLFMEIGEKSWYNELGDLLWTEYGERNQHYVAFLTREYKQLAQKFEDAGIEWIWE